jgi:hypothetical protein
MRVHIRLKDGVIGGGGFFGEEEQGEDVEGRKFKV